jgi:copper chaperone CopZ
MSTITLSVPNINCGHCVHTIQTELVDVEGVRSVIADAVTKKVIVVFDAPADEEKIRQLLAEINYPAEK